MSQQPITAADRHAHARLVQRLRDIGFVLPGSLLTGRYQRCGKRSCRCHADPPVLHGPYTLWTRTEDGKTVTRTIRRDELDTYRGWFDNARTLQETVTALQALSVAITERARPRRR